MSRHDVKPSIEVSKGLVYDNISVPIKSNDLSRPDWSWFCWAFRAHAGQQIKAASCSISSPPYFAGSLL